MTHDEWVKAAIELRDLQINDLTEKLEQAEDEVERLKAECKELPRLKWQADQYVQICGAIERPRGQDGVTIDVIDRLHEPTAAQERAAIVAWLDEMITGYKEVEHSDCWPDDLLVEIKEDIARGEHWPTEGAQCRHCLRTLQAHEQEFCDACSQLEGGKP